MLTSERAAAQRQNRPTRGKRPKKTCGSSFRFLAIGKRRMVTPETAENIRSEQHAAQGSAVDKLCGSQKFLKTEDATNTNKHNIGAFKHNLQAVDHNRQQQQRKMAELC